MLCFLQIKTIICHHEDSALTLHVLFTSTHHTWVFGKCGICNTCIPKYDIHSLFIFKPNNTRNYDELFSLVWCPLKEAMHCKIQMDTKEPYVLGITRFPSTLLVSSFNFTSRAENQVIPVHWSQISHFLWSHDSASSQFTSYGTNLYVWVTLFSIPYCFSETLYLHSELRVACKSLQHSEVHLIKPPSISQATNFWRKWFKMNMSLVLAMESLSFSCDNLCFSDNAFFPSPHRLVFCHNSSNWSSAVQTFHCLKASKNDLVVRRLAWKRNQMEDQARLPYSSSAEKGWEHCTT